MPNNILYHYTSIESFVNIVKSGKVWASDCRYLNDTQELELALNLFLKKIDKPKQKALSSALHLYRISRVFCVFSLSRSPKVLSQWRAYADNGKGVAIGFNRKNLIGSLHSSSVYLVDCIYHKHEDFLNEVLNSHTQEVNEINSMYEDNKAIDVFIEKIEKNFQPLEKIFSELLRVKNPAFSEEKEVRLVVNAPISNSLTRVSNGLMIPYLEHQIVNEKNSNYFWCYAPEIWFGPKSDKRNVASIGTLKQAGWSSISGVYSYDCGYI